MSDIRKAIMARLGEFARPGAKARFAFKVGDRVHAGFGVPGGAGVIGTITKIEDGYAYIQADASASDRYGPQTYKALVARLTAPPKKAWESSRPGAKARFGMTNAGYKALVDAIRQYGDSAPAAVVAQAKQMKQEPTEFTDNEVMAVIAKMKQARASRPGAKARFDREQVAFFLEMLGSQVIDQKDLAKKNAQSAADYIFKHGSTEQIKRFVQLAERVGLRVNMSRPGAKATAAKPESQDIESEEDKAGLKLMEKADEKVSEKIRTLIKEGKPQDQAVAIALDMKRRGEL